MSKVLEAGHCRWCGEAQTAGPWWTDGSHARRHSLSVEMESPLLRHDPHHSHCWAASDCPGGGAWRLVAVGDWRSPGAVHSKKKIGFLRDPPPA